VIATSRIPLSDNVFMSFRRALRATGLPWKRSKRGRPPDHSSKKFAWALFVRAFYGWSYRVTEAVMSIPRSCLHWAFMRAPMAWIKRLTTLTVVFLRQKKQAVCGIMDSTGVGVSAPGFKRKGLRRPYWKMHALVEYCPGFVWFVDSKGTPGYKADITIGRKLLAENDLDAEWLFADKGYDDKKFYKQAYKKGLTPIMQQRSFAASRKGVRGKVWRDYNNALRKRYRGMVETPFGGFANRYASRIGERKTKTRRISIQFRALAHNIRTLAKTMKKAVLTYLLDTLGKAKDK